MDELKQLFKTEAAKVKGPYADLVEVQKRGAALRRRKIALQSVVGGVIIIASVSFAMSLRGVGPPHRPAPKVVAARQDTYEISVIGFSPVEDGRVQVTYRVSWASRHFPGQRLCTWTLYDESGTAVSNFQHNLVSGERYSTDPLRLEANVTRQPTEAKVSCGSSAIDPAGKLAIRDVKIIPEDSSLLANKVLKVAWTYEWQGAGNPPFLKCQLQVEDPHGKRIYSETFGFSGAKTTRTRTATVLYVPQGILAKKPTSAKLQCQDR